MIPLDLIGYAVNPSTGTVHTRYAGEHAGQAYRTRTVKGVETLLDGKEPNACAICYPHPSYDTPGPSSPQKRRSGPKRKVTGPQRQIGTFPRAEGWDEKAKV